MDKGTDTRGSDGGYGSEPTAEGQAKPIGLLLREAKSNASGAAPKIRKRISPGRHWSDARRAAFDAAKRAKAAVFETGNGETESILEVGEPIAPPPPAPKPPKETVDQLAELLYIFHAMGSKFVNIDELRITKDEADTLATASANVARHYQWGVLAEKTKDWLVLAGCSCMIYGPRMEQARKRRRAQFKAKMEGNPTGGIKMAEAPMTQEIHSNPHNDPEPIDDYGGQEAS
jgi:hypothetical protein